MQCECVHCEGELSWIVDFLQHTFKDTTDIQTTLVRLHELKRIICVKKLLQQLSSRELTSSAAMFNHFFPPKPESIDCYTSSRGHNLAIGLMVSALCKAIVKQFIYGKLVWSPLSVASTRLGKNWPNPRQTWIRRKCFHWQPVEVVSMLWKFSTWCVQNITHRMK